MENTSVQAVSWEGHMNTRLYTSIDHVYICVYWFSMLNLFYFVAMVKKKV